MKQQQIEQEEAVYELRNIRLIIVLGLASWAIVIGLGILLWNAVSAVLGAGQ